MNWKHYQTNLEIYRLFRSGFQRTNSKKSLNASSGNKTISIEFLRTILCGPYGIFLMTFRLRRLCTLDFEWNEIVEIQPEIEKLKNLGLLELGNNSIVKLPDTMPNLRMLTRFNVANNCLSDFPVSVSWARRNEWPWMTVKFSFCCWKEQSLLILLAGELMKVLAWKIISGHQISKETVSHFLHKIVILS